MITSQEKNPGLAGILSGARRARTADLLIANQTARAGGVFGRSRTSDWLGRSRERTDVHARTHDHAAD